MDLWRLMAHNHWFTLNLYGYKLRLCARCSGYLLGFIIPMLFLDGLADSPGFLDNGFQQLACVLLAFPYALDWVTQSWELRKSTNLVRLATGILLVVDLFIFSRLSSIQSGRIIFVGIAIFVTFIGYLGRIKHTQT